MNESNPNTGSFTSTGSSKPEEPRVQTPAVTVPLASLNTSPLAHSATSFEAVDETLKGYHFEAKVSPGEVITAAEQLDQLGVAIDTITGVDWMAESQMEIMYDFFHPTRSLRVVVRTRFPRDNPELPSIHKVFPGANWHERETHDFFGICFRGHPDLTPFLLPEDAEYHPLRKDFVS